MKPRLAIIGSGCAGLSAAWHARHRLDVTLFERNALLGGDALTFMVPNGPDAGLPLDLGFMVCNERNYPTFLGVAAELSVRLQEIEMSFSFSTPEGDTDYALNLQPGASEPKKPSRYLLKMLPEILRFCEQAEKDHLAGHVGDLSLGEYLQHLKVSPDVRDSYIIPMAAAIWSAPASKISGFPARTWLHFYFNHGLLSLKNVPRWFSIQGGSRSYVERIASAIPLVKKGCAVRSVTVHADRVDITTELGNSSFDYVLFAVHGDQVLALYRNPVASLAQAFQVWRYEKNEAVLHWDTQVLPKDAQHWASWNYVVEEQEGRSLSCNYDLCHLQAHKKTQNRYLLSLNRKGPIESSKVIQTFSFEHPIFDAASVGSQETILAANGQSRAYFAGAYLANGFHEDGFLTGKMAVERLLERI
jgi:predicted NAD/FAD-binding protein